MGNPQQTVFIVDDDEAVLESLAILVGSADLAVQTYAGAESFLDSYTPTQSGCLVLDIAMPSMTGLELQKRLNDLHVRIPIIFITGHGDVPMAVRAMKSGAVEFVQKPFRHEVLLGHIQSALAADLQQRAASQQQDDYYRSLATLTPREKQVMEKIIEGCSNKSTAVILGISQRTVEIHRANIMQKLNIDSVAQLVEMAVATRDYQPPTL